MTETQKAALLEVTNRLQNMDRNEFIQKLQDRKPEDNIFMPPELLVYENIHMSIK